MALTRSQGVKMTLSETRQQMEFSRYFQERHRKINTFGFRHSTVCRSYKSRLKIRCLPERRLQLTLVVFLCNPCVKLAMIGPFTRRNLGVVLN